MYALYSEALSQYSALQNRRNLAPRAIRSPAERDSLERLDFHNNDVAHNDSGNQMFALCIYHQSGYYATFFFFLFRVHLDDDDHDDGVERVCGRVEWFFKG